MKLIEYKGHSYKDNLRSEGIPEGIAWTKVIIFCKSWPSDSYLKE